MGEGRGREKGYKFGYEGDSREAQKARRTNRNRQLLGVQAACRGGVGEPLKSSRNLECEGLLGLNEYDLTAKEGNFENAQQWGDKI